MGSNSLVNESIHQKDGTTLLKLVSKNGDIRWTKIDSKNYNRVKMFYWYAHKNEGSLTYYVTAYMGNKAYITLHRLILSFPYKTIVDHINLDGLDNTELNLREATPRQSMGNFRIVNKKSKMPKGVVHKWKEKRLKKFSAHIRYEGSIRKYLGHYLTPEEAARAYDRAAIQYFGEFALTNFPKEEYK